MATVALAVALAAAPLRAQDEGGGGGVEPTASAKTEPATAEGSGPPAGQTDAEGAAPAAEGGAEGAGEGALAEEPTQPAGPSIVIVPHSDAVPRAGGLRPPVEGEQPAADDDGSGAARAPTPDAVPAGEPPAGRRGPPPAAEPATGWADADAATRQELVSKVIAEESEAAVAFAEGLNALLAQELEVQAYERSTLGAEELDTLGGHRLKRRTRIDRDTVEFVARAGRFARRALAVPRPTPDVQLHREQIAFVLALHSAYEESRDLQRLKSISDRNSEFRTTANWQVRDQAVRMRDELIEVETAFTSLVDRAWLLYTGGMSAATLEEMEAELTRIAPEALSSGGDLATLVLTNESLQQQVVAELAAVLKSPRQPLRPAETADELRQAIGPLYATLLETSGVTPLFEEQTRLNAELAEIDAQLRDMGVNMLDPPERRAVTRRKAELEQQLNTVGHQWRASPPDRKTANTLIATQDALLRREQFDLGVTGALFGHRYDEIHAQMDPELLDESPLNAWTLLEEQAALLVDLNAAKVEPSLLDGLTPPPASAISAAAQANLKKKIPKPKAGKKKGKK